MSTVATIAVAWSDNPGKVRRASALRRAQIRTRRRIPDRGRAAVRRCSHVEIQIEEVVDAADLIRTPDRAVLDLRTWSKDSRRIRIVEPP